MKKSIVILALAAAVIGAASPALAKGPQRAQASQAVMVEGVSPDRASVLRECNQRIERFKSYYQMNTPTSIYRSCMHEHGQPE